MKKIFTLLSGIVFCMNCFGQAPSWLWAKRMGALKWDEDPSMTIDAVGNIYIAGIFTNTVDFDPGPGIFNLTSTSVDTQDVFFCKLDVSGNFIWAKRLGSHGIDRVQDITIDNSANIYATGWIDDTIDVDPGPAVLNLRGTYILKLDSAGDFVWAKSTWAANFSLVVDSMGNNDVYITGAFSGTCDLDPGPAVFNLTALGYSDIFICKLDSSGNFVWAKGMGGTSASASSSDAGHDIIMDRFGTGDIIVTGRFFLTVDFDPGPSIFNLTSPVNGHIFVCRFNSAGNFIWAGAMGGTYDNISTSVVVDLAGNIYTTGYFTFTADFDPGIGVFNLNSTIGSYDVFISKLNAAGNFIWAKAFGGTNWDHGYSNTCDASGNIYTLGIFQGTSDFDPGPGVYNLTAAVRDIFVSKLDSSGNFLWAVKAGGNGNEDGLSIALNPSGYIHVAGSFRSTTISFGTTVLTNADFSNTYPDIFIARLDTSIGIPTGNIQSEIFNDAVLAFPNPVTNQLAVSNGRFALQEIEIYDILGQRVFSQRPAANSQELIIDVSMLKSGIYFVRLRGANEEHIAKFVKE